MRTQAHLHLPVYIKFQPDLLSVLHCVCEGFFVLNNPSYSPDWVVIVITGIHYTGVLCEQWVFISPLFYPPPPTQSLLSCGLCWRWRMESLFKSGEYFSPLKTNLIGKNSLNFLLWSFPILFNLVNTFLTMCSERHECDAGDTLPKGEQLCEQ